MLAFGPIEIARWYQASARNAVADGKYQEAIDSASKGLTWKSDYGPLFEIRAQAKLELEDVGGALEDVELLIASHAEGRMTETLAQQLSMSTVLLQRLQRFEDSVRAWDRIVAFRQEQYEQLGTDLAQQRYALALNNRAYNKALGKIDLSQALAESQQSIKLLGEENEPVYLDTLGYLLLLNDHPEQALEKLEQAVDLQQQVDDELKSRLRQRMRQVGDQRPYQDELRRLDEQFSIILHHRGEAYETLGEAEKAAADFAEAVKLGYNPEKGIW